MRTRVKFCGLTRTGDVEQACMLGADAVGFVCHPRSPRYVPPERLAELARAVAPLMVPVLLFVDAAPEQVHRALEAVPGALLQFHGHEDAQFCRSFGRPYLRAVPLAAGVDLLDWEHRYEDAAGLLADAPGSTVAAASGMASGAASGADRSAEFGGSGECFDWARLPPLARRRLPLVLAGGLHAGNVGSAISLVRPHAVDVSSGIEQSRGIKSADRMRDFMAAVRGADAREPAHE
jgi:phosphoribosylanthranilate isomerase